MKRIITLLLAALMLFALAACNSEETPVTTPDAAPSASQESPAISASPSPPPMDRDTVEGWSVTSEWKVDSVNEDDGDKLTLSGTQGSEAFKTVFTLRDAWDLSVTIEPASGTASAGFVLGTTDLMGISWITLDYEGGSATVTVGYKAGGNFNELMKSDPFDAGGPLTLTVSKLPEDRKLAIGVFNGETELFNGAANEIPSTFMRLMARAGLTANGNATFSNVKVITYSATGGTETAIEAINPGPHVENPDYLFSDAVFNVVNGEERIIIDSAQEAYAWYIGEELNGDWTVKCRVQIGNFNGAAQGCARFSFGGERAPGDDGEPGNPQMYGMFTALVDASNNFYFQESQQLLNDRWSVKAGGSSWIQIFYPIFDMAASHKAGEDALNIQFIDLNGEVIHTVRTRDYEPGYLDDVRYFSYYVWQSQIQVTRMEYLHVYTELAEKQEETMVPPVDPSYTPFTDFGETGAATGWEIDSSMKFRSGAEGDVIGVGGYGLGEARVFYTGTMPDSWKIETLMRFENAVDDFAGRVYLYGDGNLKGIVTVKMTKAKEAWVEAQMLDGDWINVIDDSPHTVMPTQGVYLSVGLKADGKTIVITMEDEQGNLVFSAETEKMTNAGDINGFALVGNDTTLVFDRTVVGVCEG